MWEAVAEFFLANKLAFTRQSVAHRLVGLVDMNTCKLTSSAGVGTVGLNHVQRADTVGFADHKVFHTVIRRSVNGAGTRLD